jgi:dolichol-phosphate mannosyltransferase
MTDVAVADIERLYRTRFSPAEQAAKEHVWRVLCEDFFSRFVQPTDAVLDLACGYGEFINFIGCGRRLAMDINPDAKNHLAPEVEFFNRSCEDLGFLDNGTVDVVFESNLFEHLPSKSVLTKVVREVHRTLRPGGRFILMQPNIKYVGADYWDFYDHLIPLSHLSCAELLENCGFRIATMIPRFVPYTTKSRFPQHPLLVRLFVRCPPLWRLLGKQFVIVACK